MKGKNSVIDIKDIDYSLNKYDFMILKRCFKKEVGVLELQRELGIAYKNLVPHIKKLEKSKFIVIKDKGIGKKKMITTNPNKAIDVVVQGIKMKKYKFIKDFLWRDLHLWLSIVWGISIFICLLFNLDVYFIVALFLSIFIVALFLSIIHFYIYKSSYKLNK